MVINVLQVEITARDHRRLRVVVRPGRVQLKTRPLLFVQLCRPVKSDGHGHVLALLDRCIDQKTLAIAAHVVDELIIGRDWLPRIRLKEQAARTHRNWPQSSPGTAIVFRADER